MHQSSPSWSRFLFIFVLQAVACSGEPVGLPNLPGGGAANNAAGASSTSGAGGAATTGGGASGSAGAATGPGGGAAGASVGGGAGTGSAAGGSSGAASGGSAGASSSSHTGPSAGCNKPFPDPFVTAVQHDMQVKVDPEFAAKYTTRKYYTQLPKVYDGTEPMPIVFYGQGCGQNGPENSGFSDRLNTDNFILVQMIPVGGCFEAGKSGSLNSPDGPYFDQALAEVEANYCIDKSRVYVAGWSSGAWISTYLACTRGGVVRAAGTVAGGLQHAHGTCVGGAAVMMFIGEGDNENGVVDMVDGFDVGTGQSRDTFIKTNGCSATSAAWDAMYPTCQIYGSCANPVIWCPVPGGHGAGNDKLPGAAWKFWSSLK